MVSWLLVVPSAITRSSAPSAILRTSLPRSRWKTFSSPRRTFALTLLNRVFPCEGKKGHMLQRLCKTCPVRHRVDDAFRALPCHMNRRRAERRLRLGARALRCLAFEPSADRISAEAAPLQDGRCVSSATLSEAGGDTSKKVSVTPPRGSCRNNGSPDAVGPLPLGICELPFTRQRGRESRHLCPRRQPIRGTYQGVVME